MGCGASKIHYPPDSAYPKPGDPNYPVATEAQIAAAKATPLQLPGDPPTAPPTATPTPTWKPAPDAVYHRLTKIPIKPGAMPDIVKVTTTDAFKETMAGFVGFEGVEAYSADDTTMLTHSRWVSKEACDGGAAALGSVLKQHMGEYIAGPPDAPWLGPRAMEMSISGKGIATAYRVMVLNLQENKMQDVLDVATSKEAEFKAIDGLIKITSFQAGPTAAVVTAAYETKAQLEAATPIIGPILKSMGAFFSGPPTPFLAEVEFTTYDFSAPAAKPEPEAEAAPVEPEAAAEPEAEAAAAPAAAE